MGGPPLGLGGEDITWPDLVAPRVRKAPSTRKIKPQTSNLRAEAGKKCMPGRRASRRKVKERRSHERNNGVASSRARDARREGSMADTRHTAGSTRHRSTEEGSTRGTGERGHHAPRHAPHRHHTHRTHQHPRPQHLANGPRQPAERAGSKEEGAPEPRRPPPPPWRAALHRARRSRTWCSAPTPAHSPQHVVSGPRQPAQRAGSRGRGSA